MWGGRYGGQYGGSMWGRYEGGNMGSGMGGGMGDPYYPYYSLPREGDSTPYVYNGDSLGYQAPQNNTFRCPAHIKKTWPSAYIKNLAQRI